MMVIREFSTSLIDSTKVFSLFYMDFFFIGLRIVWFKFVLQFVTNKRYERVEVNSLISVKLG